MSLFFASCILRAWLLPLASYELAFLSFLLLFASCIFSPCLLPHLPLRFQQKQQNFCETISTIRSLLLIDSLLYGNSNSEYTPDQTCASIVNDNQLLKTVCRKWLEIHRLGFSTLSFSQGLQITLSPLQICSHGQECCLTAKCTEQSVSEQSVSHQTSKCTEQSVSHRSRFIRSGSSV